MTRVLVVGLHYPPHHVGGYEVSCRDVVERLAERGHEVAVLTSTLRRPGVTDPPGERDAAVPVWRDLVAWFRDEALYAPPVWRRWRIERANQAALRRALARHRPEVISVWQLGAMSLGLLAAAAEHRVPVVYAVSDDWLSYAPELDAWSRLFRGLPAGLRRGAGRLLGVPTDVPDLGDLGPFCFISEVTRERAARYAPWTLRREALVYSGIDRRLFPTPDPLPVDRPWRGRLLYVGRYDPRKGIETVVRALALLPGARLEVQGTGDPVERDRLAALAGELDVADRVVFETVPRDALVERYREADVLVFPSEWEEPFGLVPLEAMSLGTPVVATGVGGSGEFLVDGENCLRFTAGDPASLAGAVARIADDGTLRARLIRQGARTAEWFDVDRLTDAFEAWHEATARNGRDGWPPSRRFSIEDVRVTP